MGSVKISPSETLISGQWVSREGRVIGDESCQRIYELTKTHLKELGRDSTGWEALYRDPDDGRFWELTYPQGHLQGGGPPQLRCLTRDEAEHKYGNIASV